MTTDLDIRLRNGAPDEARMRTPIIDLVEKYDLAPWLYTTTLVIDRDAMPHSHPILTLQLRMGRRRANGARRIRPRAASLV